jgi:hypothetical protein
VALGEVYQHYLPRRGYPFDIAAAEFDTALALDPGFAPPLFHAAQHAIWRAQRERADTLIAAFAATRPDSLEVAQLHLMRTCLSDRSSRAQWDAAAKAGIANTGQAATWLVVAGLRFPSCARDALKAVAAADTVDGPWRFYATVELASVAGAMGDDSTARALIADLGVGIRQDVFTVLLATARPGLSDLADQAVERLVRAQPPAAGAARAHWAVGTWQVHRQRLAEADRTAAELASLAATGDREARLLSASLMTRITLARGDTAAALASLRALAPTADQQTLRFTPWEALPWEHIALAQILVARGQLTEAFVAAESFDSPASFGFLPWLRESLELRAKESSRFGDVSYPSQMKARKEALNTWK